MKIIITGGHHTPALQVIKELQKIDPKLELIWIGHKHSMKGDTNLSAEYAEITNLHIPFFDINAGKFYKVYNPIRLLKIIVGLINAYFLVRKLKPDGIISFGGYIAVPVVISGWLLKVPSVTHEQTVVSGLANKVIAHFVKRIYISWHESAKFFPKDKVKFTGLPMRDELFQSFSNDFIFQDAHLPLLYITGGKQGSHLLNSVVSEILPELLKKYNVLHQCGNSSVYNSLELLARKKADLPKELQARYMLVDYVKTTSMGEVFAKASLIVSRAGANYVYELLTIKKPALLIPISWVSHNEQYENAQVFIKAGLGEMLDEKKLTSDILLQKINYMMENLSLYKIKSQDHFTYIENSGGVVAYETYREFQKV